MSARLVTRAAAATYLSLSLSAFDRWVVQGIVPPALPGTRRWDKKAIDAALDRRSKLTQDAPSAYERWKGNARQTAEDQARH